MFAGTASGVSPADEPQEGGSCSRFALTAGGTPAGPSISLCAPLASFRPHVSMKKKNRATILNREPTGWHSRGYLPHFDGGKQQFMTFRLGDSMPQAILDKCREELEKEVGASLDSVLRRRVEAYLDQGYGNCYLNDPRVAEMVQDSLLFYDGERYALWAWVVMPNHVHLLVTPAEGKELSVILHSLKSYTAHKANRILGRTGRFWQRESFERYISDYEHLQNVVA